MRPVAATLLPLCSALGYSFAALMLKRATEGGVGPWRVTFIVNCTAALTFAPWWFTGTAPFEWLHFWHAVLAGATFFIGQILTFLALSRGDISITTPIMGTKVILVAFLAVLLAGDRLSPALWVAAFSRLPPPPCSEANSAPTGSASCQVWCLDWEPPWPTPPLTSAS